MKEFFEVFQREMAEEGFGWKAIVIGGVATFLFLSVGISGLSYMIENLTV